MPVPDQPIVAFSAEVLGFTLHVRQAAILSEVYRDDVRTAVLRLGRRSGKGRMAAVVAVYEATVNASLHTATVPPGERVTVAIIATSREQARIVHGYVRGFLRAAILAPLVESDTDEEVRLTNGVSIVTLPCSARAIRGLSCPVVILDEFAWMQGLDGSETAAEQVWEAVVPSTAAFPASRVLVLSTPRWNTGAFYALCGQAGGTPGMRAWHASTAEMNPAIPSAFLDAERAKDPAAYAREYLASFESGVGAALDAATVRAAVRATGTLPPVPGVAYVVAIDAAYVGDTFAVVVAHAAGESIVVDRVEGFTGTRGRPLDHRAVLDRVAAIAGGYGRAKVLLDQYAAEPIAQGLAERGLNAQRQPWTNDLKVDALTALRQALYGGRVEIPAHEALIGELVSLEQRPLPSGRPKIAAPPGQHDDYATALLAAVHALSTRKRSIRAW